MQMHDYYWDHLITIFQPLCGGDVTKWVQDCIDGGCSHSYSGVVVIIKCIRVQLFRRGSSREREEKFLICQLDTRVTCKLERSPFILYVHRYTVLARPKQCSGECVIATITFFFSGKNPSPSIIIICSAIHSQWAINGTSRNGNPRDDLIM